MIDARKIIYEEIALWQSSYNFVNGATGLSNPVDPIIRIRSRVILANSLVLEDGEVLIFFRFLDSSY